MTNILLDDVETGMTLASDVTDRNGRVLLKSGVELSDKHIRTLQTWGVLEVDIEGADNQDHSIDQYPDEWLAEAEEKARFHFQHCQWDHPFIQSLSDCWKLKYLKQKEA